MTRKVFLIIEFEQPEGLSSRKLVLEAARHNVLTAHSTSEGLALFGRHPVDGVFIHESVIGIPIEELVSTIKKLNPAMNVVVLSPRIGYRSPLANAVLPSHDPAMLLEYVQQMG